MWVIINDDGSTEVYNPKDDISYKAPTKKKKTILKATPKKSIPVTSETTSEKIMYLTFDDGPLQGSNNIITTLQQENVKATMFMIGKHINKNRHHKKTFDRALKEPLVLVANHTYSHANGRYRHFYSDTDQVLLDMQRMDDILFENYQDYTLPYCRLAGRNVWRVEEICLDDPGIPKKHKESEKYDALWDEGYQIFGWDYQWSYDPTNGKVYKSPKKLAHTIERIYKKDKTKVKGKFVLLMHDFSFKNKFNGKETLRTLIHELKDLGWRFETIETYL